MDVRCPKCGEPWDLDSIHERVSELNEDYPPTNFDEVARAFRSIGCPALGEKCYGLNIPDGAGGTVDGLTAAQAAETLYELLGDDMDGAASMLEDLGF